MKNFLQNLLIFFAMALCALVAFQWVRETDLRKRIQSLTDTIHDKAEAVQALQGTVKRDEAEIQRLDALKNQLNDTVKSNSALIAVMVRDLDKVTNEIDRAHSQMQAYKEALEKANENLVRQNESIKRQNEEMAKVAEERNDMVKKFNKMAADYIDLANKWNKQQEDLARAATNAPAVKK